MNYPQLLLPKTILEILNKKDFPMPIEPKKPIAPIENNHIIFKISILLIGFGLLFKIPIIGVLLLALSIYIIISNSEAREYSKAKSEYIKQLSIFPSDYQNYITFQKMSTEDFYERQLNEYIAKELRKAKMPSIKKDYKKGASHNFFKKYLNESFGDKIIEDASIQIDNNFYDDSEFNFTDKNPYIADFAYVDLMKKLFIAIEIDEPYTLKTKEPIHINDDTRNDFFLNHNWIVLRFAEEQIVLYPILCCIAIQELIHSITNNTSSLKLINLNIPIIPKWTVESVQQLILINHRQTYLNHLKNPNYANYLKARESISRAFANAPKPIDE